VVVGNGYKVMDQVLAYLALFGPYLALFDQYWPYLTLFGPYLALRYVPYY